MDLYVCSYAPTISALIESRKLGSQLEALHEPSLLLVARPKNLHGAQDEINVVQAVGSPVTTLLSEKATLITAVEGLRDHRFVHFGCHGLLETGKTIRCFVRTSPETISPYSRSSDLNVPQRNLHSFLLATLLS
ncbi:hypothetical protein EDB92DRAFT_260141 [Lactarius akahatsu]|uniref:CHAT domain-containing protein n=1 Tax=Lactarius akahatsu TaxID=416441 RepID=A0AAD4Q3D4_9AGAM|nr:hypothetical protein EDB92DRAFT_260141 [Lactarius akahatsu]